MPPGRGMLSRRHDARQIRRSTSRRIPRRKTRIYNQFTIVRRQGINSKRFRITLRIANILNRWPRTCARPLRSATMPLSPNFFACAPTPCSPTIISPAISPGSNLKNPKFDIIFAPYETYLDSLLGVKDFLRRFGADAQRRGKQKTRGLPEIRSRIQDALPLSAEDRPSKHGQQTPMEVMDAPFRSGDLLHGYQAVADNLPNDPRIHEKNGSEENFLQEFHGCARQLRHPAAGQAQSCCRSGRARLPATAT